MKHFFVAAVIFVTCTPAIALDATFGDCSPIITLNFGDVDAVRAFFGDPNNLPFGQSAHAKLSNARRILLTHTQGWMRC